MAPDARVLRDLLVSHVSAFNRGVLTGDFSAMFDMYHPQATFELSDPVDISHLGIDAIRRAYRGDPPRGTMSVANVKVEGDTVIADYIWHAEPERIAGQFILQFTGRLIARNLVTFAD